MDDGAGRRSAFSWNAGGWFGGQLGGTIWIGVLGALTVGRDRTGGGLALAAFVLLNLLGIGLWRARRRVPAYVAIQTLLLALSLATAGILLLAVGRGAALPRGAVSTGLPPWLLVVFPALMLFFHLRERTSRREPRRGSG